MATLDSDDLTAISNLIDARLVAFLALVIEGPNQYDAGGEATPVGHLAAEFNVTIAGALREILAYVAGPAENLDGVQGSPQFRSRVGGRVRIAATLVNGNRQITSHDDT